MSGYNKVADNTFPNMVPLLTGKYLSELGWNISMSDKPMDDLPLIWKNFSHHGYRTLFAEDWPDVAMFNFMKYGFKTQPTDYYIRPFAIAMDRSASLWNSNHHCKRSIPEIKVYLDYLRDFALEYQDELYFGLCFLTRIAT